jgi:cephalosporin hydroxylase
MNTDETKRAFHNVYYESNVWRDSYWHATPVLKCIFDLWVFQEIIASLRPALIIECGTWAGGSALFLAHTLDIIGSGRIITIDILDANQVREHYLRYSQEQGRKLQIRPTHPRIDYLLGSSTDPAIVAEVTRALPVGGPVMVVADSDHSIEHAYAELNAYHAFVTPGSYFVMEDTNIPGSGPSQAVDHFLVDHPEFVADRTREKFLLTFNPGGYLRRK